MITCLISVFTLFTFKMLSQVKTHININVVERNKTLNETEIPSYIRQTNVVQISGQKRHYLSSAR